LGTRQPPALRGYLFFFQAEDGIRDLYVTGVQTCALPICGGRAARGTARGAAGRSSGGAARARLGVRQAIEGKEGDQRKGQPKERSEERRVGKECRARWWRYH